MFIEGICIFPLYSTISKVDLESEDSLKEILLFLSNVIKMWNIRTFQPLNSGVILTAWHMKGIHTCFPVVVYRVQLLSWLPLTCILKGYRLKNRPVQFTFNIYKYITVFSDLKVIASWHRTGSVPNASIIGKCVCVYERERFIRWNIKFTLEENILLHLLLT